MTKKILITLLSALGVSLSACQNKEAMKALQDGNAQLADQIKSNNDAIKSAMDELNTCKKDMADLEKTNAVVTEASAFEVPALTGTDTMQGLESYKQALTAVIKNQTDKLGAVKNEATECSQTLMAAKANKEVEEAKAAAAKSTKTTAKAPVPPPVKKEEEKPVAVQKAEEAGTPTKGVRSRYKTRN